MKIQHRTYNENLICHSCKNNYKINKHILICEENKENYTTNKNKIQVYLNE